MNGIIKINFADFWRRFNYKLFPPYNILNSKYSLEISDDPDFFILFMLWNNTFIL